MDQRNNEKEDYMEEVDVISFDKNGNMKVSKSSDPRDILSGLRAQRLAGVAVEIPEELIEKAKRQNSSDRTLAFWDELESMGADVIELVHEYKDVYSFKIETPIHCYLASDTRENIIHVVKNDIEAHNSAACPECGERVDYADRNGMGNMVCECGTILGSISKNFAKFATELIYDKYGLDGIYSTLSNWDDLYHHDHNTEYDWLFVEYMDICIEKLPVAISIVKGSTSSCSTNITMKIPVFGSWENDDDVNSLYNRCCNNLETIDDFIFRIPTCSHCKYCMNVIDNSDTILDYDCSVGWDLNYCTFPIEKDNFLDKIGMELELEYEKIVGYRENNEGIIKNAFTEIILSEMKLVDRQTRYLEGNVASPFDQFYGPICPSFELDTKHSDLEINRGPFRVVEYVDIVFGLPNVKAIKEEIVSKNKRTKLEGVIGKAMSLIQNDRDAKKLFGTRIEMKNLNSHEAQSLIKYIALKFTIDELEAVKGEEVFPIDTSHRAYDKVIQRCIDMILKNYKIEIISDH